MNRYRTPRGGCDGANRSVCAALLRKTADTTAYRAKGAKSAAPIRSPTVNHNRKGSRLNRRVRQRRPPWPPSFPLRRLRVDQRQRTTSMALKVELKPNERIIIGACVVTNTDQRARLLIDGDRIPILREKDILTPETADTPGKLVYLAVQLMYISPDPQDNHGTYFNLLRDIVVTVPTAWPVIEGINNCILSGDLYQALKEAKKLIAYEKQLLEQHETIEASRKA